ncbi:hypothetical protein, partial [Aeromonas veronii]|uniref:hypothetical protein n=1 Tax=Aeromonas veronii TaxID=654 RepID=UPI00406D04E0
QVGQGAGELGLGVKPAVGLAQKAPVRATHQRQAHDVAAGALQAVNGRVARAQRRGEQVGQRLRRETLEQRRGRSQQSGSGRIAGFRQEAASDRQTA